MPIPVYLHPSSSKPVLGQPLKIGEGCRFNSFTTNNYKLHFYETPSGIKVIMMYLLVPVGFYPLHGMSQSHAHLSENSSCSTLAGMWAT